MTPWRFYQLENTLQHLIQSGSKELLEITKEIVLDVNYVTWRAITARDLHGLMSDCFSLAETLKHDVAIPNMMGRVLRQIQPQLHTARSLQLAGLFVGQLLHITQHRKVKLSHRQKISQFLQCLKDANLCFSWWCPVGPTWESPFSSCEQVLAGHSGSLTSVSWSPDCYRIASGYFDNTVREWDAATGECELVLTGHSELLNSFSWSPDGLRIALGANDNTVRLWDVATGECEQVLDYETIPWDVDPHDDNSTIQDIEDVGCASAWRQEKYAQ